jgi:hypothetical protein
MLVGDVSINASSMALLHLGAAKVQIMLFRQHRRILKYRIVESASMPTWPTWLGTPLLQGCARQKLVESHPLEGPLSGQQFNKTNGT